VWTDQLDQLLSSGGAKRLPRDLYSGRRAELRIDGLPAVMLVEHIEIDERAAEQ
jgi:hypothetical protein